jgi:hypothetical protein
VKSRSHVPTLGVLVGFAFDRNFERLGRGHLVFGVEQVEVAKGVCHFLVGGCFKRFGDGDCAGGARQSGEIALFNVGHRLAGKGGFEIFDGDGLDLAGHVVLLIRRYSINLMNRYGRNDSYGRVIGKIDCFHQCDSFSNAWACSATCLRKNT